MREGRNAPGNLSFTTRWARETPAGDETRCLVFSSETPFSRSVCFLVIYGRNDDGLCNAPIGRANATIHVSLSLSLLLFRRAGGGPRSRPAASQSAHAHGRGHGGPHERATPLHDGKNACQGKGHRHQLATNYDRRRDGVRQLEPSSENSLVARTKRARDEVAERVAVVPSCGARMPSCASAESHLVRARHSFRVGSAGRVKNVTQREESRRPRHAHVPRRPSTRARCPPLYVPLAPRSVPRNILPRSEVTNVLRPVREIRYRRRERDGYCCRRVRESGGFNDRG